VGVACSRTRAHVQFASDDFSNDMLGQRDDVCVGRGGLFDRVTHADFDDTSGHERAPIERAEFCVMTEGCRTRTARPYEAVPGSRLYAPGSQRVPDAHCASLRGLDLGIPLAV
jgi:hypothetical protein